MNTHLLHAIGVNDFKSKCSQATLLWVAFFIKNEEHEAMATCVIYIDEAGTPYGHHIPLENGETPIFTLAALAFPLWEWRARDRAYLSLKRQHPASHQSIYTQALQILVERFSLFVAEHPAYDNAIAICDSRMKGINGSRQDIYAGVLEYDKQTAI